MKSAVFARHLGQSTVACLTAMTQGDFTSIRLDHWKVALVSGLLAGLFGVALSFTVLFRHYRPWLSFALISFLSTRWLTVSAIRPITDGRGPRPW